MSTAETDPFSECACTAKVLGAYAMFEMNYGSEVRSYEVARRATQFDEDQSKLVALEAICWYETCTILRKKKRIHHKLDEINILFFFHFTSQLTHLHFCALNARFPVSSFKALKPCNNIVQPPSSSYLLRRRHYLGVAAVCIHEERRSRRQPLQQIII